MNNGNGFTTQDAGTDSSRSSTPQTIDVPSVNPGTNSTPQNAGDTGGAPPPPVDDD